ncbi:MAG: carboxymuconolactone decarboxylase family protein [Frankiales bacterium]|nr:carboxymuconolactone decarboxylase family protein [Frankiales bacterium]
MPPDPSPARVALLDDADDGPVAATFARVRAEAGGVPVLYRALGNAPAVLDAWIGIGWTLRKEVAADRGLGELAVLRVAQLCRCDYVWRSHHRMALRAGARPEQVEALADWRASKEFDDAERAVLQLVDEVTVDGDATDATWAAVEQHLGDREAVEVVVTVGWYACVARTVLALRIPLEPHHARVPAVPLPEGPAGALASSRTAGP